MKYYYIFKTSDGVRHEDSIEAANRETAFALLRGRGIRAIKVIAADGSKANGEIRGIRTRMAVLLSLCAAILAGAFVYVVVRSPTEAPRQVKFTNELSRTAYTNLEARAAAIVTRSRRALEELRLESLVDYRLVERERDTAPFFDRITAAYRGVDTARRETRELFGSLFEVFPAECAVEREEAQRLYAETMDAIDVFESRVVRDEKAYRLLVSNYGKWRVRNGDIEWLDSALANEFKYLRRTSDSATGRWSKDFGRP